MGSVALGCASLGADTLLSSPCPAQLSGASRGTHAAGGLQAPKRGSDGLGSWKPSPALPRLHHGAAAQRRPQHPARRSSPPAARLCFV